MFTAGQKLRASNLGSLSHCARYTGSSDQTIPNTTDTVVAFGSADYTSSYVTRSTSGAGHKFTLNAGGIWAVTVTIRWYPEGTGVGEKHLHIKGSSGLWHHSQSLGNEADASVTHNVSFVTYLTAGDWIIAEVYQSTGGSEDLHSFALFGTPRIDLALILKDT